MATWSESTVLVNNTKTIMANGAILRLKDIAHSLPILYKPLPHQRLSPASSLGLGGPLMIYASVRNSNVINLPPRNKRFYYWHT